MLYSLAKIIRHQIPHCFFVRYPLRNSEKHVGHWQVSHALTNMQCNYALAHNVPESSTFLSLGALANNFSTTRHPRGQTQ